jgi:large subunit ribosomal protein L18
MLGASIKSADRREAQGVSSSAGRRATASQAPPGGRRGVTIAARSKPNQRLRRRRRVRAKVRGTAQRPRISVFRSNRGIGAQLIDDDRGHTLAAVNWTEPDLRELPRMDQAKRAGELLAQRAKAAGIERAVFDRGGYRYHGRVKALAEGAREGGLAV